MRPPTPRTDRSPRHDAHPSRPPAPVSGTAAPAAVRRHAPNGGRSVTPAGRSPAARCLGRAQKDRTRAVTTRQRPVPSPDGRRRRRPGPSYRGPGHVLRFGILGGGSTVRRAPTQVKDSERPVDAPVRSTERSTRPDLGVPGSGARLPGRRAGRSFRVRPRARAGRPLGGGGSVPGVGSAGSPMSRGCPRRHSPRHDPC